VLSYLDYRGRTQACAYVVTNALEHGTLVPTPEQTDALMSLLDPLVHDQEDQPDDLHMPGGGGAGDDFVEEQTLIARLVNLLKSENLDTQFKILNSARKHFGGGGKHRIKYTLPPVVFNAYQLAIKYGQTENDELREKKLQKIFQFTHQTITALIKEAEIAELPLRLFLQGALVIDKIPFTNHETLAYEYMSQAFSLYEDEINDSRSQLAAILLIIGTLQETVCFNEENHEPLRTQCALAATRLFKKPDQCRGVCASAHLFWSSRVAEKNEMMKDGKRIVECLKKALKIASQCMDPAAQVQLFVEILNHYVYFFDKGCEEIDANLLNQLISKIRETIPQLDPTSEIEQIQKHFKNTLQHLRWRASEQKSGNLKQKTGDGDAPCTVDYSGLIL